MENTILNFKDSITAKYIAKNWSNKNMEIYLQERAKAHLAKLKSEIKKK